LNKTNIRLLVVEDEAPIRQAVRTALEILGFDIMEANRGEDALPLLRAIRFDAALVDINMPGMGGIETCREIRRLAPSMAILMLTVRDSEEDKVRALDAGADDYITKPFHVRELTARIRAVLRRTQAPQLEDDRLLRIGSIELDPVRRIVQKAGRTIHFTPKEFELLHYLMARPGTAIPHARLLSVVWGSEYGSELEYLRTYISQLRKKLEDNPSEPFYLLTDSHFGYRFAEDINSERFAV
jgi:two-component system, OmpR family, KDP operon response regulator KdpE